MSCTNSKWKLNAKGTAFSPRRSAINSTAMFIDDPLRICEAETRAIALGGEERNKKMSSFFLGHASTVIADRYQSFRTMPLRAHCQVSSVGHRIQCITDQIQNGFPELLGIDVNRWQVRIKRPSQVHVLLIEQWLHEIKLFFKKAR